ncbi:MAG: OmpH family outer membrane protein [Flavobacteriales bacterium]|nr:OmpH family outer membrane protein [Flavobacteriales bacterium]
MKNISIGLNAVLIVAVAILYYMQFSDNTPVEDEIIDEVETIEVEESVEVEKISSNIGYIDVDSLQENYKLYDELSKKMQARERKYEKELNSKFKVLEKKFIEFQQKAPTMTQFEGQLKQKELAEEEQRLYKLRDDFANKFQNEQIKLNEELQTKIKGYISEYNSDKKYKIIIGATRMGNMVLYFDEGIDISYDITKGLNEEYDISKAKKKEK